MTTINYGLSFGQKAALVLFAVGVPAGMIGFATFVAYVVAPSPSHTCSCDCEEETK